MLPLPEVFRQQGKKEEGARIESLDFLRGIAVMGILVANLPAFALPEAAYFSPLAWGGTAPADIAAWFVTFVLVEGKMRGLFSLLFGASMLLVVDRAEAAGESGAAVHYRRMAWLFVFGCLHLYGLWWGDILAHYALCGAIAFVAVRWSVRRLVVAALVLVAWQTVQDVGLYLTVVGAQAHPSTAVTQLLAGMATAFGKPSAPHLAAELTAYRGSYAQVFAYRWHGATTPLELLFFLGPETLATMLFGMAGLKSGFLKGEWSRARYQRWATIGLGVSLPVYAVVGIHTAAGGFRVSDVIFGAMSLAAPLRTPAILGYAALGILLISPGGTLTTRIAAAGRMAFTNYLATSLVMTTLFYGYGLGLFGHWSRGALLLLAPLAWLAMLAISRPWLAGHRYGPAEWLWRSLAHHRVQPMRLSDQLKR